MNDNVCDDNIFNDNIWDDNICDDNILDDNVCNDDVCDDSFLDDNVWNDDIWDASVTLGLSWAILSDSVLFLTYRQYYTLLSLKLRRYFAIWQIVGIPHA